MMTPLCHIRQADTISYETHLFWLWGRTPYYNARKLLADCRLVGIVSNNIKIKTLNIVIVHFILMILTPNYLDPHHSMTGHNC